jgi:excisionase family DNA binding protein
MERKIVTIMRAMSLTGVSRRTIYNWLRDGKVEYIRTAGGAIRIFEDSLWRDAQGRPSSQSNGLNAQA